MIDYHRVVIMTLPEPDGSFDQGDKQHFLKEYSGILFGASAPPSSSSTGGTRRGFWKYL